jgi:ABC-2 type transport system permease protein
MTNLTDALPDSPSVVRARRAPAQVRPFYWSLRRELWENRSLYLAPLIVAGLVLFGFFIGAVRIPHHVQLDHTPSNQAAISAIPYAFASIIILAIGVIVGAFYLLGALHNEKRDRSILFWKSMPVSDVTTVASKAATVHLVMPAFLFAIILATQILMLAIDFVVLIPAGGQFAGLWANWPVLRMAVVLAWALVSMSIWYVPLTGWLLMVSAWSKRAPFLWAVLPPLGLMLVEFFSFGSGHVGRLISRRISGGFDTAFSNVGPHASMVDIDQIDLAGFFSSFEVWGGLIVGLAFAAVAVWLRRTRDPS